MLTRCIFCRCFIQKYINKITNLNVLRTNMHYYIIKYLTTEPPWRKGQKSTLKETNNDALIIFKVHVYLVVIPEKKN